MRPVTVEKILACRARLGITQVLGPAGSSRPVKHVFPYPVEENGRIPIATPPHAILLFPHTPAGGNFCNGQNRRLPHPIFRSSSCACVAVSDQEIPDDLQKYSECTGTPVFASRYDHSLIYSRLIGLLREMGERRVMVHGVLVRVLGRGILLMGESGIGKTDSGLSLMHSDNRWVADDAVVLEGRGDVLYGRGHERTRNWIAVRGRGILRAEELLGSKRLLEESRVDVIIRLIRASGTYEDAGRDLFREFADVSIPCKDLVVDVDPRRMADRLLNCVPQ
jgi:serine kinase of HPr protein (carbohydrate metabolism regulator)